MIPGINRHQRLPSGVSLYSSGHGAEPMAGLASARGREVCSWLGIRGPEVFLTVVLLGLRRAFRSSPVYLHGSSGRHWAQARAGDTSVSKMGPSPPGVYRQVEGTDSRQTNGQVNGRQ